MKLKIIILGWALLSIPNIMLCQKAKNQTFLSGYFGAPPYYENNMFVTRTDTGLYFSPNLFSSYDFQFSQKATYCDENGNPLLQWQGCFLLNAKTFEPIDNGDLSNGPGTKDYENNAEPFCSTYLPENLEIPVTRGYQLAYSTFFLDRGDKKNILLVYYRLLSQKHSDSTYLYTANIDMTDPDEPTVTYKDSLLVNNVFVRNGSISAIRHANGYDWFIVFGEERSKRWHSVLYDSEGLHPSVISEISQWNLIKNEGLSTISPDGTKYVFQATNGGFMIMDFDRCTGKFRFKLKAEIPTDGELGPFRFAEFSPNGRFLYCNNVLKIYQYDLEDENFGQSRTVVAVFDTTQKSEFGNIKGYISSPLRGFDNKLYYWSGNTVRFIHRMAFPDQKGPDVGWTQDFYKTPIYIDWFLPTFVDYGMGPLEGSPCISSTYNPNNKDFISCYPNPAREAIKASVNDKYDKSLVTIYDVKGLRIYKGTVPQLRSGINIELWTPGAYLIQIHGKPAGRFAKIGE